MKETIIGAAVGTLVIISAISLYFALFLDKIKDTKILSDKFSRLLEDKNIQLLKISSGVFFLVMKILLISALAYIYFNRKDFSTINFAISYVLTSFVLVTLLLGCTFYNNRKK